MDGHAKVILELTTPACPLKEQFVKDCKRVLGEVSGVVDTEVVITSKVAARRDPGKRPIPNVSNLIAVASGKGGVGKSTVAIGLAAALAREGASVGLLDADIHGPSLHVMMGGVERHQADQQGRMVPVVIGGIPVVTLGLLAEKGMPVIWRGPMVSKMVEELLFNVAWPDLNYLIVDLPPGTGDAQLTLAQKAPLAGAMLVTTPQDVALEDVERAGRMFLRVDVPLLGVVENMSYFICPACGHREEIFSGGGGEDLAARLGVPLLAQIPLTSGFRALADQGRIFAVVDTHPEISEELLRAARGVASRLSILSRLGGNSRQ